MLKTHAQSSRSCRFWIIFLMDGCSKVKMTFRKNRFPEQQQCHETVVGLTTLQDTLLRKTATFSTPRLI
jgi:hypothetical protein